MDVPAKFHQWTPAAQEKFLNELRAAGTSTWKPFYCPKVKCDGKPHGTWNFPHARWDQHPPSGDWLTWAVAGGRGSGKTRSGSEWTNRIIKVAPRIALIAPTSSDARDTLIEGESGILATAPPGERPTWEPSKRKLTFTNGAVAHTFSGEEPDRLRGPQHHCFVAGTPIQTPTGQKPVESLKIGDMVETRVGPRRIRDARSREAWVISRMVAGRLLTGTPDHLIWTETRGWVPLSSVHAADRFVTWTGERTTRAGSTPTTKAGSTGVTDGCGSRRMAPCLLASRSITSTATKETTGSTTSSPSLLLSTVSSTVMSLGNASAPTAGKSGAPQARGGRASASSANVNASESHSVRRINADERLAGASTVEASSRLALDNSAHRGASTHGAWRTVYNIEVEDQPEYFANGVLVHNCAWLDEPAHIDAIETVWSNLLFGLRLGQHPRICVTTTPLPTKWMKALIADPTTKHIVVSTYANIHNLPPHFAKQILARYEGTRLGRQEIHGEILADVEGALWSYEYFDDHRVDDAPYPLDRIVVAVDPAGTNRKKSDETGIVIVGVLGADFYVLADWSGKYSPKGWAERVMTAYREFEADAVVVETNYGGDMVRSTLESVDESPRIVEVNSRRGKVIRADPIVALYEKERVHHIGKALGDLEDQLVSWVPGNDSPDRLDALVHGITDLAKVVAPSTISTPANLGQAALPFDRMGQRQPGLYAVRNVG